jgi:hypothetical protein
MTHVIVQHPIGGLNFEGIQKKVQVAFPEVLKASQGWKPVETSVSSTDSPCTTGCQKSVAYSTP